ncbi:NADP-dependent phosphogluconate dehydrogenase [Candidatus Purcelliella pentastirinorum]|uniref:6-phosphogluconate dehydrogenase, decarboxylating n=1 Tax=Candidatus Purcelliella pentastirinorum TaxID=472834 RepID=A0AAX3N7R4_9ENTR|nr:NADP-dependent phosphogluconate dehydrogenase [Candidatus Purcelliella pentastirinorum]WDI78536.1 NADP-dependent phosphogluconate dehydrogenase [Candidatus Purcelliella pentastirinorum]WDR80435.1 NADP-dependent phosphogluconate dehydrogenase [Candidatus Purcelliella pentastirinorum]
MLKKQIGIIGLGIMGTNLTLNFEKNGYQISIFNRTKDKINELMINYPKKNIKPYYTLKEFISSLDHPKCVLLMVKSGKATDETIKKIIPYLDKKDIIIDGGNTYYKDTIKRHNKLKKIGIDFIGMGISGGEEGALKGPSIMPGGDRTVYNKISHFLIKIAAKINNKSCVDYIGPNGSGHYVKMIHNGIEYGNMQLISETYNILKNILLIDNKKISKIFDKWNKKELNSYLIKITRNILKFKNKKNKYLIDIISDKAGNKGTGKWASISALKLGSPFSLITEAVFHRYLSNLKKERKIASKNKKIVNKKIIKINKKTFIDNLEHALYFGIIISYTQGFSLMQKASKKYKWNLNYSVIAKIFKKGCIIKAKILNKISLIYKENNEIKNLLLSSYFQEKTKKYQSSIRNIIIESIKHGIPIPTLSSALSYYDSYHSEKLPANLIQAQRDYFGNHMYERIDKKGKFHTNWKI